MRGRPGKQQGQGSISEDDTLANKELLQLLLMRKKKGQKKKFAKRSDTAT